MAGSDDYKRASYSHGYGKGEAHRQTLGADIVAARGAAGLSVAQLADQLGVEIHDIEAWEADQSTPVGQQLERLVAQLNLNPGRGFAVEGGHSVSPEGARGFGEAQAGYSNFAISDEQVSTPELDEDGLPFAPKGEAEILQRISTWTDGEDDALFWYRSHPIPAFGDRTAEALVKTGKSEALRDYLDAVAVGSFQ